MGLKVNKTSQFTRGLFAILQKIIEEVEEMLNNLPGVTSVHGRFYDLSSKYYRIIGNHASYYKDALRYLGCVDLKDLPGEAAFPMEVISDECQMVVAQSEDLLSPTETEKQERAFTLGLAGLLGEGVYNFGELVRVPLLLITRVLPFLNLTRQNVF